ncbi:hypothetical protein IF2G_01840 [Cordyceps javanica]|nr:hypothetical protein IF2G_01840 [Cordyceps javanica]
MAGRVRIHHVATLGVTLASRKREIASIVVMAECSFLGIGRWGSAGKSRGLARGGLLVISDKTWRDEAQRRAEESKLTSGEPERKVEKKGFDRSRCYSGYCYSLLCYTTTSPQCNFSHVNQH